MLECLCVTWRIPPRGCYLQEVPPSRPASAKRSDRCWTLTGGCRMSRGLRSIDLAHAVESCALRVETVVPSHVDERVAVQGAAFARSTFTVDRWHTMTAGIPYQQARCLVGYDDEGVAVAAVTVWAAGPGRPGLLEPMGVHRDHRGCGNGTSITLAAAAALREMGLQAQSSPPRPRTWEPSPPTRQLASTPLPTSPISGGLPNPSPSRAIRHERTLVHV